MNVSNLKRFKTILRLFIFFNIFWVYSQNENKYDNLYLLVENPTINSDESGQLHYLLSIKSVDTLFKYDSYKFEIPNRVDFDKYVNISDIEKEIFIDEINYISLVQLEKYEPCNLHKQLSLYKNVFLIFKKNSNNIEFDYKYIPMKYKGTEKNIEMIKF